MKTQPRFPRLASVAAIAAALAVTSACGSSDNASAPATSSVPTSSVAATPTDQATTGAETLSATATKTSSSPGDDAEDADSNDESAAPRPSRSSSKDSADNATPTGSGDAEPDSTVAPRAQGAKSAGLPTDAGDYGDEVIAAWSSGGSIRRYTSSSAAAELSGAKRATGLVRTACEDDMCSYSNEAGRRVTLTFDRSRVERGAGDAVVSAKVS